jgi:solute carrier family 25 (mitochondrial aspartate/glutamate transporter), member 12/13
MSTQIKVVKEAVKETLVGSEEGTHISAQTRAHFLSKAVQDPETGELYLGNEEFVDAVAPKNEDFVSVFTEGARGEGGITDRRRGSSDLGCSWTFVPGQRGML